MSENEFGIIEIADPEALLKEIPAPKFKIKIENGTLVTVKKQIVSTFSQQAEFLKILSYLVEHGNSIDTNVISLKNTQ